MEPGSTQSIVTAVTPYVAEDTKKGKYLSFRLSNFTVMESIHLAGISLSSVKKWRMNDPKFRELDTVDIAKLRKDLSAEYLSIEFTRNFRLVLQHDFEVLYKTVSGIGLTDQEYNYLLKLRNHYSPQHLAMIRQLLDGGSLQEPFDFTKLTMTIRREREQVDIRVEKE